MGWTFTWLGEPVDPLELRARIATWIERDSTALVDYTAFWYQSDQRIMVLWGLLRHRRSSLLEVTLYRAIYLNDKTIYPTGWNRVYSEDLPAEEAVLWARVERDLETRPWEGDRP